MVNKIFNNSLVVGLTSVLLTVVLSVLVVFGFSENQIKNDLKEETKSIAVALNAGVDVSKYKNQKARITLVDSNGQVLFDNQTDKPSSENHLSRPEIKEAIENGEGQIVRKSTTMDSTTYYYAVLLENSNILRVSMNTNSITLMFTKTIYLIAIIALFVIVLSLVLAYKLSKNIVKPIEEITENLDDIKESPYEELKPFTDKIKSQIEAEKKLAKIKRQFTANVSHELKTPLTSISGYAEMLQSGMVNEGDVTKIGKIIYKESQRLINLTHDIIQLSQLEEYDYKPIIDSVDLNEITESCVETLEIKAQKKNVKIHFEGEPAKIKGTKPLVEELAYNIIENAIKYNVENGDVFVTVKDLDDYSVLIVKDTGIGIPQKYQERVFERFFRVDKSRSKETGGTGLGLAIVKHTVDYLGGSLTLKSDLNVGTTITVKLLKQ